MDNASLDDRLLPHRVHCVGQAFQPVADQHAHVPGAAVLDLRQDPQPELGSLPVAVLPGPQAQHVTLAVHGDAQGQVDRPVRDLALPDLHVNSVNEHHGIDRVERPALPSGHTLHHPVGDRADRLLRHFRAVDLSQVRRDLPMRQPFRRQGNHHLIHASQPPLPFSDNLWLETGIPVPWHRDLHRPGIGKYRLSAMAVAGIAAVTARRVVLAIAKMVIHLAFQRALDHHLRQLAQQAAVAGQLQPAGAGPLGKLPQQLLISCRQLCRLRTLAIDHISHWCLLCPRSYTVEITVPFLAVQRHGCRSHSRRTAVMLLFAGHRYRC